MSPKAASNVVKLETTIPPVVSMMPISKLHFAYEAPEALGFKVRKGNDEEGLPTLEASIRAHGIIAPLVIKQHKGTVYVVAGNRRLKLLRKIHGDDDVAIPIVDADAYDGDVREIAMATNISLPPHPVDRYEIITTLISEGMTAEDAMQRFGMSDRQFRQTMKLGSLSPTIRELWRNGEIDAAAAQAFTLADPEDQDGILKKVQNEAKNWRNGRVEADRVLADVRGDSGIVRRVTFVRGVGWRCPCPARLVCAHARAVQLVVVTDDEHEHEGVA